MPSFIITGFYGTSSESLINYASNLGHDTHLFNNDKLENETQIINTINLGKNFIFQGLKTKISNNAGTSFCNHLYYHGLKHIFEKKLNSEIVFLHIPFEKNITDIDAFFKKIIKGIELFSRQSNNTLKQINQKVY